ncbi:alkaline phosphatase family protein [Congregibacter variabilis]|uniref:Alkaline phosphatase family protein n=1 Tax=Congregibacter variabilis TaxID=3081200 RepID=A0ABZ0I5E8_9GAMM|nr:alkaline phosphatase family protein [Congregibacter sp. IMCC43200]
MGIFRRVGIAGAAVLLSATVTAAPEVRLVLQVTVDQLRGDLPLRHMEQFGSGGFRYLAKHGVWYTNANYRHANTETIVGHSSLATGTIPAVHGMVGNVWLDRDADTLVYNVEDSNYALLSANADVDKSSEIDPTQRVANSDGRSPRALLSSTFSDQLAIRYPKDSKIFAVSVKDRGAIPLAGQSGKAFWFSKAAGEFVTSNYYYEAYPQWVLDWNRAGKLDRFADASWALSNAAESYQRIAQDDNDWETDVAGFGRTFPHSWGGRDSKYFTTLLTVSPVGDEITLDFAKALLAAEGLGQDDVPDYLSVSFSSTDYVGHVFGASSLEMEDNLIRLDKSLAELFEYVDSTVGLQHTLIVLSADHGGPEAPGYLQELNQTAQYVDDEVVSTDKLNTDLRGFLAVDVDLVQTYFHPYIYLDRDLVREQGLDLASVQTALAGLLLAKADVAYAYTATDIVTGSTVGGDIAEFVSANHQAKRSGDVYVVFKSGSFINDFDGLVVAASHGSPWRYDRHVPVIFAGNRLKGKTVSRVVAPYDIAPTLSNKLGIEAPSGAVGEPLSEVTAP